MHCSNVFENPALHNIVHSFAFFCPSLNLKFLAIRCFSISLWPHLPGNLWALIQLQVESGQNSLFLMLFHHGFQIIHHQRNKTQSGHTAAFSLYLSVKSTITEIRAARRTRSDRMVRVMIHLSDSMTRSDLIFQCLPVDSYCCDNLFGMPVYLEP